MSVVTAFGVLDYGNEEQLAQWQQMHDTRHRTERLALTREGASMSPTDFLGPIDHAWIGRHYITHLGLNRALATLEGEPPPAQAAAISAAWHDEASFYVWHRAHNLIHAHTDSQLGINSKAGN